eukprot:CAMPEP_0194157032 /NCGR_PEP_ID=MMETSP0152-20130528/70462_1 /TAXON_ID=1049557 /ORGANISM="Thalassiothrix antarctica, Strain L6-D1" /LENGTH=1458 /DNA_ID=CAMNT_0038865143 /DNA_START=158 /DNA_END=4534 /DNA_ORIENTATION=+
MKSIKGLFKVAFKTAKPEEAATRSIDISSVIRIERGQYSNRFLTAKAHNKIPNRNENGNKMLEGEGCRSISIVYRIPTSHAAEGLIPTGTFRPQRGPHRWDTLDFFVSNDSDYEELLTTLEELQLIYEEERKWQEPESRFWQFQWLDLGKSLTGTLSSSEWITLCERSNFPLKKALLHSYYKEYSDEKNISEKGLTLEDTVDLLTEVKSAIEDSRFPRKNDDEDEEDESNRNPLDNLWSSLMDSDPVPPLKYNNDSSEDLELQVNVEEESISTIAFLSFIRSEQKEFTTSLESTQHLVQIINRQETLAKDDKNDNDNGNDNDTNEDLQSTYRLCKSQFISFLASDANDIVDTSKSDDMDYPLTHYWINTSHDTFLAKLPNSFRSFKDGIDYEKYGSVEFQSYLRALHRGARCLELDVYDGVFDSPVVARKMPTSPSDNHSIAFVQVLESIRSFLHHYPDSLPIILCLENHCSQSNQVKMVNAINNVFVSEDLLHCPPDDLLKSGYAKLIPSPNDLKGKVIIKNKRPKIIRKGASVMNDDFDEDNDLPLSESAKLKTININDEDEDEIEKQEGYVVRFDASGPIRSNIGNIAKQTPIELYDIAREESLRAQEEAMSAQEKELRLNEEAKEAEVFAQSLITEAGFTIAQVKARVQELDQKDHDEGNYLDKETTSMDSSDVTEPNRGGEGLEVQDFFSNTVEDAKSDHSEADTVAKATAVAASKALQILKEATRKVEDVKARLEEEYRLEKAKANKAQRAANEVRSNREHAGTARQRVETVKQLLRNSKDNAASAGTVVVTAMTEAKISEQRASETESRASRALNTAEKERVRADKETKKEENLENEAALLHEKCVEANRDAKTARSRMEKCASMLDRVNEQIKLIESSAQFQKELKEFKNGSRAGNSFGGPRHGSSFLSKHNSKIQEKDACTKLIKEASVANTSAELRRKRIQANFEDKAHLWKMQSEVASQARKQADRSSHHAEELAELAEEEREAASLRHIAREKAQMSVSNTDDYQSSIQAQLAEASRASEEAASFALESRISAEKLDRELDLVKDHTKAIEYVNTMEKLRNEKDVLYQEALKKQNEAEAKATNAKRLLDTSSEVFTNAKRDAAQEQDEVNTRRQTECTIAQAYRKFLMASKLAKSVSLQTKSAVEIAEEKERAEERAFEYKFKVERLGCTIPELANLTFYHSTKFKTWEESRKAPNSHMHSISEPRVKQILEQDEELQRENFRKFTKSHICRIFPSWRKARENQRLNYDPVVAHGLGCQLVSMNFHSCDEHLLLNDGRFRVNGSSGYVLKPPYLRGELFSDRPQSWRFNILRGFYLPKGEASILKKNLLVGGVFLPSVSPFVRVSLYEGKVDAKPVLHETKAVRKNGFSPIWNEGDDEFEVKVEKPSVALLLFTVWDQETSDFIAGAAVSVNHLRQGYRSIALFDSLHSRIGPYASASLIVRAQKL